MSDELKKQSLAVVLPAYNEEAVIEDTIERVRSFLESYIADWEILVVNDGSTDLTGEICETLAIEDKRVRSFHHNGNQGYGAALQTGISNSRSDLVFFMDSDGQFDISEIDKLFAHIKDYDIVAGYRQERQDAPHRKFNAWGWNQLVKLILGIQIRDIDCAFKLFRRSVFERVQINSVGAMVNTEVLAQTQHFGMTIKELPITHYPRTQGHSTGVDPRVIIKAFRELFKMRKCLQRIDQEQKGLLHGKVYCSTMHIDTAQTSA